MEYNIKQLKLQEIIFFPQTSAEAVIVHDNNAVNTLDNVLKRKLETVVVLSGSGLNVVLQNNSVVISHANSIVPNENPLLAKIKYDNCGHIIDVGETGKFNIIVNQTPLIQYDGNDDKTLLFSDSFKIDENKIEINWNNINNGTS